MREKKPYDFSFEKVKKQVIVAFKKNHHRAMVADLVALTGLPVFQITSVLPAIVDECRGHLQVNQTGEILYYFPKGLASQKPSWSKKALVAFGQVLKFLFKTWIMVMLVGYFLLFVCILFFAILVSMAASLAKRDNRDRGSSASGVLGFYLVTRVLDFFLLLWLFSGDPTIQKRKKKRPFYKAVFDFVFGVEEKPKEWENRERKAAISFIQQNKGLITLEELMVLTGRNREQANSLISRFLLEFEGEPLVSDAGTLYYAFPELMKTSSQKSPDNLPEKKLIPFSHNTASANNWIVFLNGFNLVFGIYFLFFSWNQGLTHKDPLALIYQVAVALVSATSHTDIFYAKNLVTLSLGIIPTIYSILFFGIPLVRRYYEKQKNQLIRRQNLSRKVGCYAMANPEKIDLATVQPNLEKNTPAHSQKEEKIKEKLLQDFSGPRAIEVVQKNGLTYFKVQDLAHEVQDMLRLRQTTANNAVFQDKVIFDSREDIV